MSREISVAFAPTAQHDAFNTFSSLSRRPSRSRFNRACFFQGIAFFGKNVITLAAGWIVSIILRACLGAANKTEPGIFHAGNGTELVLSDLLSCFITLLLCHFWVKPSKSRLKETCCDPKLLLRTAIRDTIPFVIGVASLFLVKFIDVAINGPEHVLHGPNNVRLFEESDVASGLILLLSFHLIDRLLEWKSPSDPYQEIKPSLNDEELSLRLPTVQTERSPLFNL